MLTINDLKVGLILEVKDSIYQVLSKEFVRYAKGKPVMVTKLKDLNSGKIIKHTFQQSDTIKEANTVKSKAQFLYRKENNFYFMDNETFDQFLLTKEIIGSKTKFLKENTEITILKFEEKVINIILPVKMNFKVTSAPPDTKGNSVQSGVKEVEIETGFKIKTPLFIETGDIVKINTEKEAYVERVS